MIFPLQLILPRKDKKIAEKRRLAEMIGRQELQNILQLIINGKRMLT